MEHAGKGSNDEEIANDIRQQLGQTATAQRESDDSDSSAERASVDFEHSDRNCNSGDQRGRGVLQACGVRWGRRGRGGSKSQYTCKMSYFFIFPYTVMTKLSFSAVF